MAPRAWTGTEVVPSVEDLAVLGITPSTERATWLAALPCAGAVISVATGAPRVMCWNAQFTHMLGSFLDQSTLPQPAWVGEVNVAIRHFAMSDEEFGHFQFERRSPLGVELFVGHLAWLPCETVQQDVMLLTVVDQSRQRRIEDNLRRELVSDSLTTLPNRIGFGECIERLANDTRLASASHIMVMVVDVERFGRVNESLGSLAGDELILTVAKRLTSIRYPNMSIARLGGNEFALAVPIAAGVTDVMKVSDLIKQAMAKPIRLSGYQISIECALGCALSSIADVDADILIRRAQSAGRLAKKTGRLEIYRGGVLRAAERRFQIESRLREALAKQALRLVYQPLVDLQTGAVIGFEALSRWTDEELGVISPPEFIEVAEESGLIVPLGRWALNEALQQLREWDSSLGEVMPISMSVNVSPIQLVRDDLVALVSSTLTEKGLDGRRLTLELTESAIIADPENCRHLLTALKGFNVSIAMDDFGSGFSNLASLQRLPIDVLKIDQSFVTKMLDDPDKLAITRAIQSLAQALKLKTTAEGVETAELADVLRNMGCTTGQGFHFARPMEPDEAFAYWRARRNAATA